MVVGVLARRELPVTVSLRGAQHSENFGKSFVSTRGAIVDVVPWDMYSCGRYPCSACSLRENVNVSTDHLVFVVLVLVVSG